MKKASTELFSYLENLFSTGILLLVFQSPLVGGQFGGDQNEEQGTYHHNSTDHVPELNDNPPERLRSGQGETSNLAA